MKLLPFAAPAAGSSARRELTSTVELDGDQLPLRTGGTQSLTAMHAPRRIQLTRREETIVAALMAGRSNKAIARELGLTEQSVKNRLTKLYRKFGVSSRVQLILALTRQGR